MTLARYVARRTTYTIVLLLLIASFNFWLFGLIPGGPLQFLSGNVKSAEQLQTYIKFYGLDQPYWVQFSHTVYNTFTFSFIFNHNFTSFVSQRPVVDEIAWRLPNTLALLGTATIIELAIGVILGTYSGSRRGSKLDIATLSTSLITQSVPTFWIGIILIYVFGYTLSWFPLGGIADVNAPSDIIGYSLNVAWHAVLPVTTLVIFLFGGALLTMRSVLIDIMTEDYILTARAKGLTDRAVTFRHALRNATLPLVTIIALSLTGIFGGAVITETVFSWPGIGIYLLNSAVNADFPTMNVLFYLIAFATIIGNFAADVLYALLDPRVRV